MIFTEYKGIQKFVFAISIGIGTVLGFLTYKIPVSQMTMRLRVMMFAGMLVALLLSLVVYTLTRYNNVNQEFVIDDMDADYFEETERHAILYAIFGAVFGIVMLLATFVFEFHIENMPFICSAYYIVFLYFFLVPIFSMIKNCIEMVIYMVSH